MSNTRKELVVAKYSFATLEVKIGICIWMPTIVLLESAPMFEVREVKGDMAMVGIKDNIVSLLEVLSLFPTTQQP